MEEEERGSKFLRNIKKAVLCSVIKQRTPYTSMMAFTVVSRREINEYSCRIRTGNQFKRLCSAVPM